MRGHFLLQPHSAIIQNTLVSKTGSAVAATNSLSSRLQWRGVLCLLLLGALGGGTHYLLGLRDIEQRLAQLHTLVEQRFVGVLAQSVWDLDQHNTQQLLESINQLDGVNRVELITNLGQRQSSQLHPTAHSEWIRDFPVQSERSGNQPLASLRLHLGQQELLQQLRLGSLLFAGSLMAAMLLMLLLCRHFMQRQLLRPLEQLLVQLQKEQALPLADGGRELGQLGKQLQRYRQNWQEQLQQQQLRGNELQKQREQLSELASQRTTELDQLTRSQQLLARLSHSFLRLPPAEQHDAVTDALARIGHLLGVDRCYLLLLDERQALQQHISWQNAQLLPDGGFYLHTPLQHSPWLLPQLRQQAQLTISRLEEIPPDGHGERLLLAEHGIHSLVLIALDHAAPLHGIFGCEVVNRQHDWLDKELTLLRLFAEQLAGLLLRHQLLQQQETLTQQLAAANARLQAQSHCDGLTGLASVSRLQQDKQPLFEQAFLRQQALSALMLDIDQFAAYNSHAGHLAGDDCLQRIARLLQAQLAAHPGLAVRIKSATLLLLLPQHDQAQAAAVAEQLRLAVAALQLPHPASRVSSFVSVSVGCATLDLRRHDDIDDLIAEAAHALRQAKEQGRNRCVSAVAT